jgi:hypothetical protein
MKYTYIDPQPFITALTTDPLWYLALQPQLDKYFYSYDGATATQEFKEERDEVIKLVMELFDSGKILFGSDGEDFDKYRSKHIDTLVIHHPGRDADQTRSIIEVLHLLRLYARYYAEKENSYYGKPIWSGHFYNGKMTFITYHYLVYPDGMVEHILPDGAFVWQAGSLNMNSRSIAICLFAELEHDRPTKAALDATRSIIRTYPGMKVVGHCEVKPQTTCPGDQFLGVDGWKQDLIKN